MKSKDQILLEEAYDEIANKPGHYNALTPDGPNANKPGHYNALTPDGPNEGPDANRVKHLYDQIMPLAEKILGGKKMVDWNLDKEDESGMFNSFTNFALKRITINAGSPQATSAIAFGNLHNNKFLQVAEINQHATTPKKYAAILKVLEKKAQDKVNEADISSMFKWGGDERVKKMAANEHKDLSMIDNLIKQLEQCKSSGAVRLVFTTSDESQDFHPTKVIQQGETDSARVYLKPL
jgi:hypothetical protein